MPFRTSRGYTVHTVDGALLRVLEVGDGAGPGTPTLVLAHGWTLSHLSWGPVVERLRAGTGARIVLYDQRDHGGSSPGSARPSVRVLGDDLAAVVAVAAPHGPLVLAGHSMGGMGVLAFAGRHREEFRSRVRGVVLASTAAGDLSLRRSLPEALVMQALARAPRLPTGRTLSVFGQEWLLFGDAPRPQDVREVREQLAGTHLPTIGQFYAALGDHDEAESAAQLAGVRTDILVGARDRLTPVHHSRRLGELIPHSHVTVLPGLGHMLTYEAPGALAAVLRSHLDAAQAEGG